MGPFSGVVLPTDSLTMTTMWSYQTNSLPSGGLRLWEIGEATCATPRSQVSLKVMATEKGHFRASCEKKGGSILSGPLEGFSRDEAISRIYVWASA